MEPNPYPTYEDAVQEYLVQLCELMQLPPNAHANTATLPLPERSEAIARISSQMIMLAEDYLKSSDTAILEGIRGHFVDQAAAELLIGLELLQVSEGSTAFTSAEAIRITREAALREAINAVQKSSSLPVKQGIPAGVSLRAAEAQPDTEALAELVKAAERTAGHITQRAEELGSDICCDLTTETEAAKVLEGASLSLNQIAALLHASNIGAAAGILLNVCRKITLLCDNEPAVEKIRQCLSHPNGKAPSEALNRMLESLQCNSLMKKIAGAAERSRPKTESLMKASDAIKASSEKFTVLTGRMRKLEDAIRLARRINIEQIKPVTISLQVGLLSALLSSAEEYTEAGLSGVLRELDSR